MCYNVEVFCDYGLAFLQWLRRILASTFYRQELLAVECHAFQGLFDVKQELWYLTDPADSPPQSLE